jgi:surface protein
MKLTNTLKLLIASTFIKKLSAGDECGDTGRPLHPDTHKLTSPCTNTNFTYNSCSNCCGYQFSDNNVIYDAVDQSVNDKDTAILNYGEIKCWDVSSVTYMSSLFARYYSFNEPIRCWNVSSVTDMRYMFEEATSFSEPIGTWDVSSISSMNTMFVDATSFNQPIGTWDVSSVTDMGFMFQSATSFNQSIGTWNVGRVTDMSDMFWSATSFNQPIDTWKHMFYVLQ